MDNLKKNCLNKIPSSFRNTGLGGKEDKFKNNSYLNKAIKTHKF